ncbi:avidin-related protein 4/5-like [Pleurodeles waltl]|uniref:avidin-related protein 4/5-like n=1 Tax=Pleurodeles waltl TaxID=8319 RepID=UPI003709AB0D
MFFFDSTMALRCLSGIIALVLLVAIADSAHGLCSLGGSWRSEHGTLMTMRLGVNGIITGTYQSSSKAPTSVLIGYQQQGDNPTFGVTVKNSAAPTITMLAGQCYTKPDGEPTLRTTWILREPMGNLTEDWKSSRFGTASFSTNDNVNGEAAGQWTGAQSQIHRTPKPTEGKVKS